MTSAPAPPSSPNIDLADLVGPDLDRLYGYCVRLAGDPHDAEDLVQETLLRAIRRRSSLRDPSRTRAWLFAIATNCWKDQGRARGRTPKTTPLDTVDESDRFSLFQTIAIEDPFPYSDELHLDFLRLFRDEDVQEVFGAITAAFRLPLILTVIHGFSCKEAAGVLDIPLGTLLSRLHRGRKQLERLLEAGEPLATDADVLQEILHRYGAIRRLDAIEPCTAALLDVVDRVFPIELEDVRRASSVVRSSHLLARDALHLAVMQRRGIDRILAFDRAFDGLPGIARVA